MPITHTLNVDLDTRSYPIYIGSELLNEADLLTRHIHGQTALIVSNDTVAPLYLEAVQQSLDSGGIRYDCIILDDGEQHKRMWTSRSGDYHYIATTAAMRSYGRQYARRDGVKICGFVIYGVVNRCVE